MTAFDRAWAILKMERPEYQGSHGAPIDPEYHAPLHDMTVVYPEDLYSPVGPRYYGDGSRESQIMDRNTHRLIMNLRGKPDAEVMIYRSVPWEIENAQINPGDWVSISRDYARNHGLGFGNGELGEGGYRLLEMMARAKDLFSEGNSLHEYGWRGHT